MRTGIRSSTFWWALVFLALVVGPTRAFAAGAPSPAPTPASESYYITWNETMKGRDSIGEPRCEYNQSSTTSGAAIVRFKSEGNPPELKRDYSRIISGNLTDERDTKCHSGKSDCDDFVQIHEHWSYQPIQPIIGMDWWMQAPAKKQDDGSWVIPYALNGESAYVGPGKQAPYVYEREETGCYGPCLEEGPMNMGCVKWGQVRSTTGQPPSSLTPYSRAGDYLRHVSPGRVRPEVRRSKLLYQGVRDQCSSEKR